MIIMKVNSIKRTGMLHIASLPGGGGAFLVGRYGLSCLLVLSVVSEHIFLHLEMKKILQHMSKLK